MLAQARTGTGKTAAFALPIIERVDPQWRAVQALLARRASSPCRWRRRWTASGARAAWRCSRCTAARPTTGSSEACAPAPRSSSGLQAASRPHPPRDPRPLDRPCGRARRGGRDAGYGLRGGEFILDRAQERQIALFCNRPARIEARVAGAHHHEEAHGAASASSSWGRRRRRSRRSRALLERLLGDRRCRSARRRRAGETLHARLHRRRSSMATAGAARAAHARSRDAPSWWRPTLPSAETFRTINYDMPDRRRPPSAAAPAGWAAGRGASSPLAALQLLREADLGTTPHPHARRHRGLPAGGVPHVVVRGDRGGRGAALRAARR